MNNQTTQPVGFINFHGMHLLVMQHQGIEYVGARPLVDLAGIDWRSTKRSLLEAENVQLFGTKELPEPNISYKTSTSTMPSTPKSGVIPTLSTVLCIELEAARLFLARVNTAKMRAHGNETGADKLLALQKEWAKVLHDYETQGYALKDDRKNSISELLNLIKIRDKLQSSNEKRWIGAIITEQVRALGIPESMLAEEQNDLFK